MIFVTVKQSLGFYFIIEIFWNVLRGDMELHNDAFCMFCIDEDQVGTQIFYNELIVLIKIKMFL